MRNNRVHGQSGARDLLTQNKDQRDVKADREGKAQTSLSSSIPEGHNRWHSRDTYAGCGDESPLVISTLLDSQAYLCLKGQTRLYSVAILKCVVRLDNLKRKKKVYLVLDSGQG